MISRRPSNLNYIIVYEFLAFSRRLVATFTGYWAGSRVSKERYFYSSQLNTDSHCAVVPLPKRKSLSTVWTGFKISPAVCGSAADWFTVAVLQRLKICRRIIKKLSSIFKNSDSDQSLYATVFMRGQYRCNLKCFLYKLWGIVSQRDCCNSHTAEAL